MCLLLEGFFNILIKQIDPEIRFMEGLERFLSFGKGRDSQTAIVFPCTNEGHILQMPGCSGWKRRLEASEILPHEFFFSFFPECREVETDGQKQFKKGELLQQKSPQTENLSLHLVCPYDLPRMDQVFSEFNTLHLRVELALHFFSPGEIKQDI